MPNRGFDLSIVVPTYREVENLPSLAERVFQATESAGIRAEMLVVDDDSGDGTVEVCEKLAESLPVRLLVRRDERGLATAALLGLKEARGEVLLVMDADHSHPPEKIGDLYRSVSDEGGFDIAVGSRYVAGGNIEEGWGWHRWLNSVVAKWLSLGLTRIHDPMAGFFAIRREVFEAAPPLRPLGYKILLELLAKCPTARVEELAIDFQDRHLGESKLNLGQQLLYLRHLQRLYEFRFPEIVRVLKYAAVGCTGLVVDVGCFALLHRLAGLDHLLSRALSFVVAASWNWAWNRRFTFHDARDAARLPQWSGFLSVAVLGFLLNWGSYFLLTTLVPFFAERRILALICGVAFGFVCNYLGARFLVFRKRGRADG